MLRNIIQSANLQGFHGINANLCLNAVRTLFTPSSLGMDGYQNQRTMIKSMFASNSERFREKMNEFCQDDSKNMVFSDDLKNMIHLAEKEDVPLVVKMLKKFASQNNELRFGTYVFGPVMMRLFHHLGDVDTALSVFKDDACKSMFSQWMTYQVLCDMLYEKQRYQDILDVYEIIKERQGGEMFPKCTIVLVFAACYKLNTPESFKYTVDLWNEMSSKGHIPMRRTVTFGAALAFKQNAPHVALQWLQNTRQQSYITIRNMKVLAMLELGRVDDVVPILRSVLESAPNASLGRQTFCREVIDKVRTAMETLDNKELKLDYERIEKYLLEHGHVQDTTIEDLITSEIDNRANPSFDQNKNRTFINASFQRGGQDNYRDNRRSNRPYQQRGGDGSRTRPGLNEMY